MSHPPVAGLAAVLDHLITLEPPLDSLGAQVPAVGAGAPGRRDGRPAVQGSLASLYGAARRRTGRPLADRAAELFLCRVAPDGRVLVTTGLVAPGIPRGETDGPAGAAALARALILGRGVRVTFLIEAEVRPVLLAAIGALADSEGDGPRWRRHLEILAFPTQPEAAALEARRVWKALAPTALVGIEKLGPNARGVIHNMRGQDVTSTQARTDAFFPLARRTGALTVGIGDRGNEIGLGGLLRRAQRCVCPCGGSTACVVRAAAPVVAFSSNWGAYAMAAALAARLEDPRLLHRPRSEARMLREMVRAGAVDGATRKRSPTVDGGGLALQVAMVGLLGALVGTPDS